jgi:hypothetical protein
MKRKHILAAVTLLPLLLAGGAALAQKTYRCGSVYQDRPCAGQDGKVVNSSGAGQAAAPKALVDSDCEARGEQAQKIVWAREAGKTERDQSAALGDADLVREVYRQRGNAVDVRKSVEANCMARKQQGADARAAGTARPDAPASAPAASVQASAPADDAAAQRKSQCASLKGQIDAVRLDQRAGGDDQRLNALKRKQRDLERAFADQGC